MSNFFEIFAPGTRHWREQQDLEKSLIVETPHGASGPQPLDLDAGKVVLHPVDRGRSNMTATDPEPDEDPERQERP